MSKRYLKILASTLLLWAAAACSEAWAAGDLAAKLAELTHRSGRAYHADTRTLAHQE